MVQIMDEQEKYLSETSIGSVILRSIKKLITELTSIKTLFLAFLCVAIAHQWVSDIAGIIGGLATIGVKEIPQEVFMGLIQKILPSGGK